MREPVHGLLYTEQFVIAIEVIENNDMPMLLIYGGSKFKKLYYMLNLISQRTDT